MLFTEPVDPMLPDGSLFVWNALIVLPAAIIFIALISIYRNRASLTLVEAIVWIAAVIIAPVLGSLAWLLFGRRRYVVPAAPRVGHDSLH